MSFYVTTGRPQDAQNFFENIENPSTAVWNLMIRGHGHSEMPWKPVEFYNRMVAAEAEPSGFTYSFLLSGCGRSGLMRQGEQVHGRVLVNGQCSNVFVQTNLINLYAKFGGDGVVAHARHIFDDMSQRSIVSWNSMLSGYIRHGNFDEARRIFDEMPHRNVVSWTTMIAGCAQSGKSKQALSFFREMRRARVELDQAALIAALSACSELIEIGVKKPPDRSWIQINGVVHDFVAGDMIHKHSFSIYEILYEITKQVHQEGYEPDFTELFLQ